MEVPATRSGSAGPQGGMPLPFHGTRFMSLRLAAAQWNSASLFGELPSVSGRQSQKRRHAAGPLERNDILCMVETRGTQEDMGELPDAHITTLAWNRHLLAHRAREESLSPSIETCFGTCEPGRRPTCMRERQGYDCDAVFSCAPRFRICTSRTCFLGLAEVQASRVVQATRRSAVESRRPEFLRSGEGAVKRSTQVPAAFAETFDMHTELYQPDFTFWRLGMEADGAIVFFRIDRACINIHPGGMESYLCTACDAGSLAGGGFARDVGARNRARPEAEQKRARADMRAGQASRTVFWTPSLWLTAFPHCGECHLSGI